MTGEATSVVVTPVRFVGALESDGLGSVKDVPCKM